MAASVGLSGAGLAKLRSAVTVVSARAGALQLTTAPAAFLRNSKLVRQCLSWVNRVGWPVARRLPVYSPLRTCRKLKRRAITGLMRRSRVPLFNRLMGWRA